MQCRGIREIGPPQDRLLRRILLFLVAASLLVFPAWAGPEQCPVQDFAIEAALGNAAAQYNLGVERSWQRCCRRQAWQGRSR